MKRKTLSLLPPISRTTGFDIGRASMMCCRICSLGALALIGGQRSAAETLYYDGSNGNGLDVGSETWSTSIDAWSVEISPAANNRVVWTQDSDAIFLAPGGTSIVTVSGLVQANSITFATAGYTVAGTDLTLTGSGAITATADGRIDAPLAGSVGLTKSGTGNVTLAAGNTFTGNTYVNQGTLTLTGAGAIANSQVITLSGGSTLNVSGVTGGNWSLGSSQTLTGSGAVTGATTIYGTHAAGDAGAPGSQAFSSTLTYGNSSIFSWDLNAGTSETEANANNSGSYDKITAIGAVTSAETAEFMVNLLGGTAFTNAFWDTNKTWSNIIVGGSGSESLASIFTTFSGADISSSGVVTGQGQFSFSGNNLQWTAVPEPTTALAGILLGLGLLRRRR